MRLFVAVDIPDSLKEKIVEIEKQIESSDDIKCVENENLHYTLKFLGEVEEKESENIVKKIEAVSKQVKKFKVHAKGVGYFGSPNFIRVIWVGCEKGSNQLVEISKKLEQELKYIREDDFDFHLRLSPPKLQRRRIRILFYLPLLKYSNTPGRH